MTLSSFFQQQKKGKGKKVSLVSALHHSFGPFFYMGGIWLLFQNGLQVSLVAFHLFSIYRSYETQYVPSLLLRELIRYFVSDDADDREWFGYVLALGMFVALLLMSTAENQYFDVWYATHHVKELFNS